MLISSFICEFYCRSTYFYLWRLLYTFGTLGVVQIALEYSLMCRYLDIEMFSRITYVFSRRFARYSLLHFFLRLQENLPGFLNSDRFHRDLALVSSF